MKARAKGGFSLMEMMVALAILVFIIMGIGFGMSAGTNIYRDAVFEADSASMAGIINTSLGDILRYSTRVTQNEGNNLKDASGSYVSEYDVEFVFTSLEYGVQDAYFYTPVHADGTSSGILQIKNLKNDKIVELVNSGAYPNLEITDFEITYYEPGVTTGGVAGRGGYFEVTYDIFSTQNEEMHKNISTIIRLMNQ